MERFGINATSGQQEVSASGEARANAGPAVRDATEILARAEADAAAADEARERYRMGPMTPLDVAPRTVAMLEPDEVVVALRESVLFERREPHPDLDGPVGMSGELLVTTRRLLLIGRVRLSIGLDEIDEAVLSGERLLLVIRGGRSVSVAAARPRLLRVEISAARAAARG